MNSESSAVVRASPEMPALEVLHALGIAMQPELTARVDWDYALWGLVAVDRVEFLRVEPDDDEASAGGPASASGGNGTEFNRRDRFGSAGLRTFQDCNRNHQTFSPAPRTPRRHRSKGAKELTS